MDWLSHLVPEVRSVAELDDAQRIDAIQRDRWVNYSRATEALERLERLLHTPKRERMPCPVRQVPIPKVGKPGEWRNLGVPTIYDRVCQQALLNRLEPIFEPEFDDASFGYRRGRSAHGALRKVWKEIESGGQWIVDTDLRDYFGSVQHDKLLALVARQVADGRVLRLIKAMLEAGSCDAGHYTPSERGTPQGRVVSPLLSNILLTPFDREMRERRYQLTRFADDWVVTCETATQAKEVLAAAQHILSALGVELHPQKMRIVHVRYGFEFLGYKIKQGARPLYLPANKIRSGVQHGSLYAYPRDRSIQRFMDQVRRLTRRKVPLTTVELIKELNPILAGWGRYYRRAHVRRLFHRLDAWIVRRLWSHRFNRWHNAGWKRLPERVLYGEYGLVNLIGLIPSIAASRGAST